MTFNPVHVYRHAWARHYSSTPVHYYCVALLQIVTVDTHNSFICIRRTEVHKYSDTDTFVVTLPLYTRKMVVKKAGWSRYDRSTANKVSHFQGPRVIGQTKIIMNIRITLYNHYFKYLTYCSQWLPEVCWVSSLETLCQAFTSATFSCCLFVGLFAFSFSFRNWKPVL